MPVFFIDSWFFSSYRTYVILPFHLSAATDDDATSLSLWRTSLSCFLFFLALLLLLLSNLPIRVLPSIRPPCPAALSTATNEELILYFWQLLDYFYSSKSEIQGQEVNSQQAPNLLLLLLMLLLLLLHSENMPNGSSSNAPVQ